MLVKICGIKTIEAAQVAVQTGADLIGFVFAPSKRRIDPSRAAEIAQSLPQAVKKVGVFVNESVENIKEIADQVGLDIIQLHGDESPDIIQALPYEVIKAFSIDQLDQKVLELYDADYYLIDSPSETYRGGSGKTFDWNIINELNIKSNFILAGGLSPDNIQTAIQVTGPIGVDVSSGVETNGEKDLNKIKQFILNAKG